MPLAHIQIGAYWIKGGFECRSDVEPEGETARPAQTVRLQTNESRENPPVSAMNTEALSGFLKEANQSTYANKDALKASSSRLGSNDYHFEKGGLVYHDTYFGSRDFIGGEIVYENNKPAWGANYFGFILKSEVHEKEVYNFLREALMQEPGDIIPVRGPVKFSSGNKVYQFSVDGNLTNFYAKEEILFEGEVVYRCFVHGGMII